MYRTLLYCLSLLGFLPQAVQFVSAATFDRMQQSAIHSTAAGGGLVLDLVRVPGRARLLAVGEQGSILYSDDQGLNWRQGHTPVSVLLTAVQMVSSTRGWAVGHDGVIMRTDDAGEHWQLQASGQALAQQQRVALEAALRDAVPQQGDDLRWQLEDIRLALEEGAMPTLLDLYFLNTRQGFVLGAYGTLFRTDDGGQSWQSLSHRLPNPDRLHLNALLHGRNGRLLLAGEAGLLLYSDDLGLNWQEAVSPYDGSFFALAESDRFYLLGLRGHLFSSADGVEWRSEPVPTRASLNAALVQDGRLYLLGQGGVVLRQSEDGFVPVQPLPRYSYTAGLLQNERLLLVGEGGIQLIELAALKQGGGQ